MPARSISNPRLAPITAPALRSRAMGIFASAGFGAFWAATGLSTHHGAFAAVGYVITLAILGALVAAAGQLFRRARQINRTGHSSTDDRRHIRRRFLLIFIAEIAAMNVAAWLLVPDHMTYLIPVIAIIVGVHFYPLAPLFNSPHYHLTGSVMALAGTAGCVVIALGYDGTACTTWACATCAVALWISGGISWHLARRRLPLPAG